MSLTGQLDFIPLEEALRLLARSYKTGCLRIDSADVHGRVYLHNGSVTFATISTDDELKSQLMANKLVNEDILRSAEVSGRPLTDSIVPGGGSIQLSEYFREEVIESLYRIRKPGKGQFVFNPDMSPRYRGEQTFDVEQIVSEADRRAAEWADIESVIPSLSAALSVASHAPDGSQVNLAANTWRLIAGFASPATVLALAQRLGISDFKAAKDLGAMVREGLVEMVSHSAPSYAASPFTAPEPASTYWDEPIQMPSRATLDADSEETLEPVATAEPELMAVATAEPEPMSVATAEPEPVPVADPNQSWWQEPTDEVPVPAAAEEEQEPEPEQKPEQQDAPSEEDDDQPRGSDSFLDRVFAQLNETPEGQSAEPPTPTHGFLKRRRMSSIGIDE